MKKLLVLLLVGLLSCKKDKNTNGIKQAGKYCPLVTITSYDVDHFINIDPIRHLSKMMDTLAKYPQLKAVSIHSTPVYIGRSYALKCHILYKGLLMFDKMYTLIMNDVTQDIHAPHQLPRNIQISAEPAITASQASDIAKKEVVFENCPMLQLGLSDKGNDSIPDYRLVWRITGDDSKMPFVELDAQTGSVYKILREDPFDNSY